jgi:hypothetical protein
LQSPILRGGAKELSETVPKSFRQALIRLLLATTCKEPVLLIGPTAGKTLLVETWAEITRRKLIVTHLSSETETPELIGQMHPYSFVGALEEVIRAGRMAWRRTKSHLLPAWMVPGSARDVAKQTEVENLLDRVDVGINQLKDLLDAYKASTKLKAQKRDDEKVDCLGDAGTIAPSNQAHTLAQTGDWALKCQTIHLILQMMSTTLTWSST